jgi:ATP-dependent DNA helicase RecQ
MRSWGHDTLSTFGIGTEYGKEAWQSFVSELLRLGHLERDPVRRTLLLTQEGLRALKEQRTFEFAKPRVVARAKGRRGKSTPAVAPGADGLFEVLRTLRKRIADEQGVPPYNVFSDATLRELAARRPTTLSAFRQIGGVGDVKLERYGETFLDAIASF